MKGFKQFKPTSWSIDNRISIYVMTVIITLFGISSYNNMPKESFPEIVIPTIYVSTAYPGTSPADMENLVSRPIEKHIKSVAGVRRITSNSVQDFSNVIVEFSTTVDVAVAKQKIKDAVDRARPDLPNDLPADPSVMEVDFSEMPIMFVNISGNYDLDKLKDYAVLLRDEIEQYKEITRVDIVGAPEREVQVDVDKNKMEIAKVTLYDVESAIARENMTVSGGTVNTGEMKRTIRVVGEFTSMDNLRNLVVRSMNGAPVYLKDLAVIRFGYKEKESYARMNGENVITLNVVKRSGQNLVVASDKINALIHEMQKSKFPKDLSVIITGDQSTMTRNMLSDLFNSIIIGFILVTVVLMFFMGSVNALFVALSVPLASLLTFMILPGMGYTLNMMVLFSFLFALGIIVDDAIVVVENTHRIFNKSRMNITDTAKYASGEVFIPVLAGTLTTLAPFFPLLFWPGVVGKFMKFLPATLIITLTASLVVAFIMNPVFAVSFMKRDSAEGEESKSFFQKYRGLIRASFVLTFFAIIFHLAAYHATANFLLFLIPLLFADRILFRPMIRKFQDILLPALMNVYENILSWSLSGRKPYAILGSTFGLLITSVVLFGAFNPGVVFFPSGDPNYVYTYINMPVGTDQAVTDSITRVVEKKVFEVVGKNNPAVDAIIANVAVGAGDPMEGDRSITPHKSKVTVAFVPFQERNGRSTKMYLDSIRKQIKGIPGAEITVDQEHGGPPTGKPINIEISGDEFMTLNSISKSLKKYLDSLQIGGVEELKSDIQDSKPEIIVEVDRERANREGISTGQIGGEIRAAVFGKEASKYRIGEDQYPIQLRFNRDQRANVDELLNLKITYRDMATGGQIRQIPLSSLATVRYANSFGGIKRKNLKRVVTLSSNLLTGYNPNEVVQHVEDAIKGFHVQEGYEVKMTGEQEDQKESMNFLMGALGIALGLIFIILVTQFNSVSKPLIILTEILFCVIGVLLGFVIFQMQMSIVMTGIGIVALAGIVVKNGILLVEFTDALKSSGVRTRTAIIQAGRTRMNPVLLTAATTMLGLIPVAIGFNINFETLFSSFNPQIFFGGDSAAFWKPLSWTIIFGLGFATFLTLILVPVMYYIVYRFNVKIKFAYFRHKPVPVIMNGGLSENEIKELIS